jgi:recombination protein RecT
MSQALAKSDIIGDAKTLQDLATVRLEAVLKDANPTGYSRIRQSFLTAALQQPKIYQCDRISVIDALCKAVSYGLETDGVMGRAYLIPREVRYFDQSAREWRGKLQLNFQLGYKGVAEFFYRANPGGICHAAAVHRGDDFEYSLGTDPKILHRKAADPGELIGFYAWYKTLAGFVNCHVMSAEEMAEFSDEFRSDRGRVAKDKNYRGVWDTRHEPMGQKTVLVQLLKYAALSPESQRAIAEEEYRSSGDFVIESDADDETKTRLKHKDAAEEGESEPAAPQTQPTNGEPARKLNMRRQADAPPVQVITPGVSAIVATPPVKDPAATPPVAPLTPAAVLSKCKDCGAAVPVNSDACHACGSAEPRSPIASNGHPAPLAPRWPCPGVKLAGGGRSGCGGDPACTVCHGDEMTAVEAAEAAIEESKKWAAELAAKATPEGRAKAAKNPPAPKKAAPVSTFLPELPPGYVRHLPAGILPIDWMEMTAPEVFETYGPMSENERMTHWKALNNDAQTKISGVLKAFAEKQNPPAAPEASPAESDSEPDKTKQAREFIRVMEPPKQLAWVLDFQNTVPSDQRAVFKRDAGIDRDKLLNENPIESIEEYAVRLATSFLRRGMTLPKKEASAGGRPTARV